MEAAAAKSGEKLAARLGVTCYDKLLLKQAAKEGGVSLGEVERQDEKPVSASAVSLGQRVCGQREHRRRVLFPNQLVYDAEKEAILDAADKGGCVIIGRCASSLLRDRRTYSPCSSTRMKRIASRGSPAATGLTSRRRAPECARRIACAGVTSIFTPIRSGATESYDVMLSSSYYGVDGCVEMICKNLQMKGNSHE